MAIGSVVETPRNLTLGAKAAGDEQGGFKAGVPLLAGGALATVGGIAAFAGPWIFERSWPGILFPLYPVALPIAIVGAIAAAAGGVLLLAGNPEF